MNAWHPDKSYRSLKNSEYHKTRHRQADCGHLGDIAGRPVWHGCLVEDSHSAHSRREPAGDYGHHGMVWSGTGRNRTGKSLTSRKRSLRALKACLHYQQCPAWRGRITLEFRIGTNMDHALLLVANRLDRVPDYPDEIDQPILDTSGSEDNAIAWMIVNRADANNRNIHEYGDFINDIVKERLERVPGIGRINVYGGSEREIHVTVDPRLLARYRITVNDLTHALQNANISLGAGSIDEGKRRYVVRTEGETQHPAGDRGGPDTKRGEQRQTGTGHGCRCCGGVLRFQGTHVVDSASGQAGHGIERRTADRSQRH